jgi:mono/diheme cytochrome c family protein
MRLSRLLPIRVFVVCSCLAVFASIPLIAQQMERWNIPQTAADEKNPIPKSDAVMAKGKDLYKSKCQKCHGPGGKGDGPDADPDHAPDDLTDATRAARNPDGVVFYKVWNGRSKPKMPAASMDMSKEEVWTLVHYVQGMRKAQ